MPPNASAFQPVETSFREDTTASDRDRLRELGQFLTPPTIADFMASLFEACWDEVNLLDAGAGTGTLSAALIKRLCSQENKPKSITLTAYEIDESLMDRLYLSVSYCREACSRVSILFSANIFNEDFIRAVVPDI